MKRTCLILTAFIAMGTIGSLHANDTSKTNPKMKKFLNLFPGSDANPKNGVLTKSELYTFLLNKVPSSATSKSSGYWGRQMKRFYNETGGKPDKHSGRGGNDGVLTKSELLRYVGR